MDILGQWCGRNSFVVQLMWHTHRSLCYWLGKKVKVDVLYVCVSNFVWTCSVGCVEVGPCIKIHIVCLV